MESSFLLLLSMVTVAMSDYIVAAAGISAANDCNRGPNEGSSNTWALNCEVFKS